MKKLIIILKEKKLKIAVDNVLDYGTIYDRLYFYKDFLQYFQTEIKYSDVKCFKLSMSSSIGYMKFMEVHMNYYVDLDIVTQHDTYSFQIDEQWSLFIKWWKVIKEDYSVEDPLGLVDIYLNKRDMV